MHYEGHLGGALAVCSTFLAVSVPYPWHSALIMVTIVTGAMLPDIDAHTDLLEHRGLTHTIAFALLMTVIGYGLTVPLKIDLPVGMLLGLGVLTHIALDSLNPMGVRPFRPISDREFLYPGPEGYCEAGDKEVNQIIITTGILLVLIAGGTGIMTLLLTTNV